MIRLPPILSRRPSPGKAARVARCSPALRPTRLFALCAALLVLTLAAGRGTSGTLDASQIHETDFPSGLKLLVKEAHAAELASVQVWIRAGGFLEDEKTSGTAHLIEHLIFKGSDTGGSNALDSEIENLGGLEEAATEKDWTRFTCTVNSRYAGKVLAAVGEALLHPQFRKADLEAEKPLVLEEITQEALAPEVLISRSVYRLAFKQHPYRSDVRGSKLFVDQAKLEDVRAFYDRYYVPSNMTVVVVGDVDAAGIERAMRAAFNADARPPKAAAKAPAAETPCAEAQRTVMLTDLTVSAVGLAFPAPSVRDQPDTYAMDLLVTILEDGVNGRLPRLLRGVNGIVDATYETRRQAGLMIVTAAAPRADPEQLEALLRRELDFIATHPVSEAELSFAKRSLHGSYATENETFSGQAMTLGYYAAIDNWKFASDYLAKVDAVTADQLQETARKYLSAEHSVAALLKPRPLIPARPPQSGT